MIERFEGRAENFTEKYTKNEFNLSRDEMLKKQEVMNLYLHYQIKIILGISWQKIDIKKALKTRWQILMSLIFLWNY